MKNRMSVITITLEQLKKHNACCSQVKLFEETFSESVSFNSKAEFIKVVTELAQDFNFHWAAENLLEGDTFGLYKEATDPHWKVYQEAVAPHRKAYEEVMASRWKVYEDDVAPYWKTYAEASSPYWKAHNKAVARTFATCYADQCLAQA